MTRVQHEYAIQKLDSAFAWLQDAKLFLQGNPLISQERAEEAVQAALARVAAARIILVASNDSEPT
jgi:hypothetical protein